LYLTGLFCKFKPTWRDRFSAMIIANSDNLLTASAFQHETAFC